MLKNIRLHIEKNEQKQAVLDEKLAQHILETQHRNVNAFQRNIPSLLPYIDSKNLSSHSLFNNKFGEVNIVDYGQGRVLYGFHPEEEVAQQVKRIQRNCTNIDLNDANQHRADENNTNQDPLDFKQLKSFVTRQSDNKLPEEVDCLVVLGCGLALHLKHLLAKHKIKFLIIYEPQIEYFQCSAMTTDWVEIFDLSKKNGTALFLQLEKDGRDVVSDIQELVDHYSLSNFHLYKHYNHPVFDSLESELTQRSWQNICANGFTIKSTDNYEEYLPHWTKDVDLPKHNSISEKLDLFKNNLQSFKTYFPDIYKQFNNYKPKFWLPVLNKNGEVNILKKDNLCAWYGESPKSECNLNFENFNSQPNKDGLVLGYSGTKLAHYVHYQFVKKTEELLKEAEDEIGELPETVASIIMFGLGSGYQLETLLSEHSVEKLFICEPNRDFFYASLYAIDWQSIFKNIENSNSRIYLNIGDDGTNLFRDLLSQFHSIGPYILNNTFFYQSYYNSSLNKAIAQLREQLQVVISMGEYFDHAYYGISHTKEGMKRGLPLLTKAPDKKLKYDEKEVPIFLVGNGPSLDNSIEVIKEWQNKAIIVSCGTALQVMYKNKITPDFHAEIEQNRTTFDWPSLIGDLNYLKKISLISCNGIHPDTCTLYKDVYVAFKEGESSTVSALRALDESQFGVLQHAFPTVSNFACDLFSSLGFTNIYLLGIDLGFADVRHHHSKESGYYLEDGKEAYDYGEKNNTSLVVPGNFRRVVNTKHEFKVSRQIIEQVLVKKQKTQTFYNCSDGAKINGAIPLNTEDLLIVTGVKQKKSAIMRIKHGAFSSEHIEEFIDKYEEIFSHSILIDEIESFQNLVVNKIETNPEISRIIDQQKELLFKSYKKGNSLLFYYLYGTVNYVNALLLKLSVNNTFEDRTSKNTNECIELWRETLSEIKEKLKLETDFFDNSNYKDHSRHELLLINSLKNMRMLFVTNSASYASSAIWCFKNMFPWFELITIASYSELKDQRQYDYVIYIIDNHDERTNKEFNIDCYPIQGDCHTVYIVFCADVKLEKFSKNRNTSVIFGETELNNVSRLSHNAFAYTSIAIRACIELTTSSIIIPRLKFTSFSNEDLSRNLSRFGLSNGPHIAIRYPYYSIVPIGIVDCKNILSRGGARGLIVSNLYSKDLFVFKLIDNEAIIALTDTVENEIADLFSSEPFAGKFNLE